MTHDEARAIIRNVLSTGCFFVAPGAGLRIEYRPTDHVAWEIFRGHLLDCTQTRLRKTFESWEVIFEPPDRSTSAAIISVKLDLPAKRIYVVRNILVYGWEAHEIAPNVVGTREAERWIRELVGTVELAETVAAEQLRRRISRCVFLAVVGTSRLPITSLESPLPAFSLGQIAYVAHRPIASRARPMAQPCDLTEQGGMDGTRCVPAPWPMADPRDLIEQGLTPELSPLGRAKLLETVLRSSAADDVPSLAELFVERWRAIGAPVDEIPPLVRMIFNHAALSPYTRFVDNLVGMLLHLARRELLQLDEAIDVFSYLLRHLARHLTAFDLVTFHNLGANYPDALVLDTLLKAYISIIEAHPEEFTDYQQAPAPHKPESQARGSLGPTQGRSDWLVRRLHEELRIAGFPVAKLASTERPGVVALEDAHRAASDFVFLRTTQQSLAELLACYDFGPLRDCVPDVVDWLLSAKKVLLIRTAGWPIQQTARPFLAAFDADMQKRIEFGLGQADDGLVRYVEADGIEYLQQGLRVLRVWAEDGCDGLHDWTDDDLRLPPCLPGEYPRP